MADPVSIPEKNNSKERFFHWKKCPIKNVLRKQMWACWKFLLKAFHKLSNGHNYCSAEMKSSVEGLIFRVYTPFQLTKKCDCNCCCSISSRVQLVCDATIAACLGLSQFTILLSLLKPCPLSQWCYPPSHFLSTLSLFSPIFPKHQVFTMSCYNPISQFW